jgi:hypothetical protein
MEEIFLEGSQTARYSVEVGYRTEIQEAIESFVKITLGYVSAAMKKHGYHCKIVISENPYRVIVSSRNWDDGEWTGIASFDYKENCFIVGEGTYNKERQTVSVVKKEKSKGKSASDVVKELKEAMESLKRKAGVDNSALDGPEMKRGPNNLKLNKPKKMPTGKWTPF